MPKKSMFCPHCNEWVKEPSVNSWGPQWTRFYQGLCPKCETSLLGTEPSPPPTVECGGTGSRHSGETKKSLVSRLFGNKEKAGRQGREDESAIQDGKAAKSSEGRLAVRILIAHTESKLATSDAKEVIRQVWNGQVDPRVEITSHPLTESAWASDQEFAHAWLTWQQMLQHKYGEDPYWEDHKTFAFRGTITRTQQRFYIEIYYKDQLKNVQLKTPQQASGSTPQSAR